jgi:hypothetical protein
LIMDLLLQCHHSAAAAVVYHISDSTSLYACIYFVLIA